jgi:catechol 2,3-dioxygenase-like lactoylglutathione lyase family enzyme
MSEIIIKKTIPTLPVVDLKETVAFYQNFGFTNLSEGDKRSRGYAVMKNDLFEFHLYTYKKLPVPTPTNIYCYEVAELDLLHELLEENYYQATGKKPTRTGLPRMGTPKNLNADRRFTLTDPNGNHFIFIEPFAEKVDHSSKTKLEKLFWESNTLAYSHESPYEAKKMLEKAIKISDLQKESTEILFQSYVLLTDCALLLGEQNEAKNYYAKAEALIGKITDGKDAYLVDSVKQFENFYA